VVRANPSADTEMVSQLAVRRNSLRARAVWGGFWNSGRRGLVCFHECEMTVPMPFSYFDLESPVDRRRVLL